MGIQDNKIYTKGDNNPARDTWFVLKDKVERREAFVFPYILPIASVSCMLLMNRKRLFTCMTL